MKPLNHQCSPEECGHDGETCPCRSPNGAGPPDSLTAPQDAKSNPSNGLVERLREAACFAGGVPVIEELLDEAADALALYQQEGVLSSQRGENRSANAISGPTPKSADTEAVDSAAWQDAEHGYSERQAQCPVCRGEGQHRCGDIPTAFGEQPYYTGCENCGATGHITEAEPLLHWLPIETAPRDGTRFLAWDAGDAQADILFWSSGWPHTEHGDALYDFESYITHWMPLPASPATPIGGLSLGVEGDQTVSVANSGGTAQAPKSDSAEGH